MTKYVSSGVTDDTLNDYIQRLEDTINAASAEAGLRKFTPDRTDNFLNRIDVCVRQIVSVVRQARAKTD